MKTILIIFIIFNSINTFSQSNTEEKVFLHNNEVIHNNYELDNIVNLIDADTPPIYKGCEEKKSNSDRVNCLNTMLSIDTTTKFLESGVLKQSKLKRGNKKVRVVFIIDENGNTIVKKILGNWPSIIVDEIKKAVESTPKLIPAIYYKKKIPVKYSIKIYFTV